jgi:hypothetical protein
VAYQGDTKDWQADMLEQEEKQTKLLKLIAARLEAAFETDIELEDME